MQLFDLHWTQLSHLALLEPLLERLPCRQLAQTQALAMGNVARSTRELGIAADVVICVLEVAEHRPLGTVQDVQGPRGHAEAVRCV